MDTATNARRPLPLPREEKAPGCGPRYGNAASLRCQGGGTLATEFELMWADVGGCRIRGTWRNLFATQDRSTAR